MGANKTCLDQPHEEEHEARHAECVRLFNVQLHETHLVLGKVEYKTIISDVDTIIHNAWQLDFSLSLKAFQVQLHGTRSLIDWSLQSPRQPCIAFRSSVSSMINWPLL